MQQLEQQSKELKIQLEESKKNIRDIKNSIAQVRDELNQFIQNKDALERRRIEFKHQLNENEFARERLQVEKHKIENALRRIEQLIDMK